MEMWVVKIKARCRCVFVAEPLDSSNEKYVLVGMKFDTVCAFNRS